MNQDTSATCFKPRVLVVDDEKRIRDGCFRMLSEEGFEVELAENGEMGLKKIEESHFDIILLDLMMPGLSGLEVLPQITAAHPDTVIIVITGYATIEHSIDAMKKGAFDFIPKPFSPQDLRLAVAKALEFIRTLQDIATEKSRMRVMINQLGDGVLATDNQERIALANPAFLKMMGAPAQDILGKRFSEIFDNAMIDELIGKALAADPDEMVELTAELILEGEEDTPRAVLEARCVPFRDRLQRSLGTLTVLHDITALKKIDQMKSDFVSMVAHEIRGPMNSVLMQLKVMMDGLAGPVTEKQTEIMGRASERIRALSDLTTELLDLAKIESGLIAQEREQLDMNALLTEQTEFYQEAARAKAIALELAEIPQLPPVMGNKGNIQEVLANLIGNAIRYTPENGAVSVSAAAEGDFLCVRVKDSGIGMTLEEQKRIFDRFYRVKNEKTRHIAGTGLGLAIVKSIVEAHNGRIQVDSEPEKGTTFSVYLPRPGM